MRLLICNWAFNYLFVSLTYHHLEVIAKTDRDYDNMNPEGLNYDPSIQGDQHIPPQKMPVGHKNYFVLNATEEHRQTTSLLSRKPKESITYHS